VQAGLPLPKRFVQAGVPARLRAEALQRAGTQAWQSQEFFRSAQDKASFHSQ